MNTVKKHTVDNGPIVEYTGNGGLRDLPSPASPAGVAPSTPINIVLKSTLSFDTTSY